MKKICFCFNHLQYSDGVARVAIEMANNLATGNDIEVTLCPLFRVEKGVESIISKSVKIKPIFKGYFKGLTKVIDIIPRKILHYCFFGKNKYDIKVGFQHGVATKVVASCPIKGSEVLIWIHGYDPKLCLRKYYLKADKIVCVSLENKNRLLKEIPELSSEKVYYCYNSIDDEKVRELGAEEVALKEKRGFRFVTVGRLSEEKGYLRLLSVLSTLKEEGYKYEMIFVGDGPQKSKLLDYVKRNSLENEVDFVGSQSNPHKYTSKADVFICSSFSEGYSTACTEAVMLNVPVISTLVGGAEEIISDSEAGLVVDNTEDGLYKGLRLVLDNPSIVEEWKRKLSKTKYNFSKEKRVKRLKQILDLLDEKE